MTSENSDTRSLANELLDSTFADGSPLHSLLRTGAFPAGWPERYLLFLDQVKAEFSGEANWPREIVAVVYNTSIYCTKRYHDWQRHTSGVNEETERLLERLRWSGDDFVLGWRWRLR